MSNLTAALIKVDNLTVQNAQAGAIKAGNFNFTNLNLSGNLNVSGSATATTKTQSSDDNSIATTAFVKSALGGVDVSAQLITKANVTDLALKAPLASPVLTGVPQAPTAELATSTTQIATTQFVQHAIDGLIDSAPGTLNTLKEIADSLNNQTDLGTSLISQLTLKADTSALNLKANLESPTFTGAPKAPTASVVTNDTQVATTAFVQNTFGVLNNTVNQLSGKTFCLNLVDVMGVNTGLGPVAFSAIIKFNKNQSFTLISRSCYPLMSLITYTSSSSTPFKTPGEVFNYSIVSDQVITFNTKNTNNYYFAFTDNQRVSTITFNSSFTEIVDFNETLTNFTIINKANTIVNGIVAPTDVDDFYAKFLVSYNANNGSADFPTPSATSVKSRYNIAEWQKNLAIYLMTRNTLVRSSVIGVSSYTLIAKLIYEQKYLIKYVSPGTNFCGKIVDLKMDTSFIESDAIYSENLPMELHNSAKRLNGTSDGKFEPDFEVSNGKNCAKYEIGDNFIKQIAVRGLDIIAHNNRIHLDPSQMNYIKGRSLTYCRHSQALLSDTYWYPDGPEFRINLGPLLTVTKLIFNDVEVPLYLVKRKSWNPVGFETADSYNAITFNIAKAGVTIKYSTSSTYTEDSLNKVEIWYQGTYVNNSSFDKSTNLITPSSNNISLGTLMGNPDMYEQCKKIGTSYGYSTQPEIPVSTMFLNENIPGFEAGYYYTLNNSTELSMIAPTFSDTTIEFSTSDQYEYSHYLFAPSNDITYDMFYHQVEIMCPRNFVANSGGKHLDPVYSDDKQFILYRFVPGAKSVGDDYRSCYSTSFAFRIKSFKPQSETITLTDNRVINYYTEIPDQMKDFYNLPSTPFNKNNIQSIIRSIETVCGPYPFDTYGTAIAQLIYGAMENIECSVYGLDSIGWYTIIHETFHMWWQNKAGFETLNDWWIDEGYNTFCDWWVLDNVKNHQENLFYKNAVRLTLDDGRKGLTDTALIDQTITGNYDIPAFIFATMYYNFGSEFKTSLSGRLIVKLINSVGQIAVDVFDNNTFVSRGLLNPVTRMVTFGSNNIKAKNDFTLLNTSYSIKYVEGRVSSTGVLTDTNSLPVEINGETLVSYLRLPDAPLTAYYEPLSSNTNFWNCMKYVLNTFSGKAYNFTTFKLAFGDYVEENKANWNNKWPSTRAEAVELFDQMVNTGSNLPLGGGFYNITINPYLLPSQAVTTISAAPGKYIKLVRDNVYYNIEEAWHLSDTNGSSLNTSIDFTKDVVFLRNSSNVFLPGSTEADYSGFDCTGKIVFILRGGSSTTKHNLAVAKGAAALIVIDYSTATTPYYIGFSSYIAALPLMSITYPFAMALFNKYLLDTTQQMKLVGRFSINYTP